MPINMTDYRMIINERVYNVLQIMIDFAGPLEEGEMCIRDRYQTE